MAPPLATEDYYLILELEPDATPKAIEKSYKRLALIFHPDKNRSKNATEAFQKIGQAYDTLKDADSRREYDAIYHTVRRSRPPPPPPKPQAEAKRPEKQAPPPPKPRREPLSEEEQIEALQKSVRERFQRWQATKEKHSSRSDEIQDLKQKIQDLEDITAAEKEEQLRRDRAAQERRIEKDLKERRLNAKEAEFKKAAQDLKDAKKLVDAADEEENRKLRVLQASVGAKEAKIRQAKEAKAKQEREEVERARLAELQRRQREQRMREEQEAERRQQEADMQELLRAQARALARERARERQRVEQQQLLEEQLRQEAAEEEQREQQRQQEADFCSHEGWWTRWPAPTRGRYLCPHCGEARLNLLQCPGCPSLACRVCMLELRPQGPSTRRPNRGRPHRQPNQNGNGNGNGNDSTAAKPHQGSWASLFHK